MGRRGVGGMTSVDPLEKRRAIPLSSMVQKREKPILIEKSDEDRSGSLYKEGRSTNNMYAPEIRLGSFLQIDFVDAQKEAGDAAQEENPEAEGENQPLDQDLAGILADFPNLAPSNPDREILKSMEVKVLSQYENGDYQVGYYRSSKNGLDDQWMQVLGRLPVSAVRANPGKTQFLSSDLRDIDFKSSSYKENFERTSTEWQNEYTLRLSGFEESESVEARKIASDLARTKKIRDDLQAKAVEIGAERKKLAKEREGWMQKLQEQEAKVKELEEQVSEASQ